MRVVVGAFALATAVAFDAGAQPGVATGDRVRVRAPERVFDAPASEPSAIAIRSGIIARTTRDSLWIRDDVRLYALSRDDVVTIEVARRGRHSAVRGAVIGGLVTGVVLGWYGCEFMHNCDDINTPSRESRLIGGILPGAVVGALIAHTWRTKARWVEAWADP